MDCLAAPGSSKYLQGAIDSISGLATLDASWQRDGRPPLNSSSAGLRLSLSTASSLCVKVLSRAWTAARQLFECCYLLDLCQL